MLDNEGVEVRVQLSSAVVGDATLERSDTENLITRGVVGELREERVIVTHPPGKVL